MSNEVLKVGTKVLVINSHGSAENSGVITAASEDREFVRVTYGWPAWFWGWAWARSAQVKRISD